MKTWQKATFISPEETDSPSYGIILENPDADALTAEGNVFIGKIDKAIVIGSQID